MVTGLGQTNASQQLSSSARRYIESRGHSIRCRQDPTWFVGPQGGEIPVLCSIDGGPYEHGAYAINLNPSVALVDVDRQQAIQQVAQESGVSEREVANDPAMQAAVSAVTNQITQQRKVVSSGGSGSGNGQDLVSQIRDEINKLFPGEGNGANTGESNGESGPTDSGLDIFGSTVEIFGYDVPIIALAAGAGLLLMRDS